MVVFTYIVGSNLEDMAGLASANVRQMIDAIDAASQAMQTGLNEATASLRTSLVGFNKTVRGFNDGVHDFSEFNYALQGTVERLDVTIRDFGNAVRGITSRVERSDLP